jgi:hypothetical protein
VFRRIWPPRQQLESELQRQMQHSMDLRMEKNKSLDDAERKMKVRRGTRAGARGVALGPCPLSSEAGRETSVKAAGASCRCSFPCARTLTLLSPLACKQCDLRNLEAEMEQLKERLAQEELDR